MICIKENVFEDKDLAPAAKLFYAYLDNNGVNNSSNGFYSDLFNVSSVTINNWLFALEKKGYIKIKYYKKERNIYTNKF